MLNVEFTTLIAGISLSDEPAFDNYNAIIPSIRLAFS